MCNIVKILVEKQHIINEQPLESGVGPSEYEMLNHYKSIIRYLLLSLSLYILFMIKCLDLMFSYNRMILGFNALVVISYINFTYVLYWDHKTFLLLINSENLNVKYLAQLKRPALHTLCKSILVNCNIGWSSIFIYCLFFVFD